ncbi:MAG: alkaline phosphatase family protein [Akkermansiaceae bacterium]|nr:alkaline phosphatase family protein [Verrucomicrobiales bacterium]
MCNLIKLFSLLLLSPAVLFAAGKAEHIVVVVWDGMRPDFISREHTPTLHQLAQEGVMFEKHHSAYITSTEVNGTAIATGQNPEHSGIMANKMYFPKVKPLESSDTQASQIVLDCDHLSHGHYLLTPTLAEILQAAGKKTVIAGTKQVALLHDRRQRPDTYTQGINLHEGKTLPGAALKPITNLLNRFPGAVSTSGPTANEPRDQWTTRAMLGPLWTNGVPEFSLLWLSEPDFSLHAAGPGSPKAMAALESSDRKLALVLEELKQRGIHAKTDVFVVSDHGFSTIGTSVNVADQLTAAGFKAFRKFPAPPQTGEILVIGQGGSVLFYVIGHDRNVIHKLVEFLQAQEFSGVILTRKAMQGTFSLADARINTPNAPDVVLSMRWTADKSKTGVPGIFASDGGAIGRGNHASLSRFDLNNTLVAAGPDFKKGFKSSMPSGNMDLAPTILWLLDVKSPKPMDGRVLSEALTVKAPKVRQARTERILARKAHENFVWQQYLQLSRVNKTVYLDEGNGSQVPK